MCLDVPKTAETFIIFNFFQVRSLIKSRPLSVNLVCWLSPILVPIINPSLRLLMPTFPLSLLPTSTHLSGKTQFSNVHGEFYLLPPRSSDFSIITIECQVKSYWGEDYYRCRKHQNAFCMCLDVPKTVETFIFS